MTRDLTFSLFLPQAATDWPALRAKALLIEQQGWDGLWLVDHFFAGGSRGLDFFEGWTALSALAEATDRLRLGLLVSCNSYRNPALVAKMACTLDRISDGRLELGMGSGWMEEEYLAYGFEFAGVRERLDRLDEGLEIIRGMLSGGSTTFEGRYYKVLDAPCEPRPVQEPLPITVGGAGEKVLLRIVARHATRWNCPMPEAPEIPRLRKVLEAHCREVGRDPDEITISEQTAVIIGRDEKQVAEKLELAKLMIGGCGGIETMTVVGTPDQVTESLLAKTRGGVTDFTVLFGDFGEADSLELFSEQVVPALREGFASI